MRSQKIHFLRINWLRILLILLIVALIIIYLAFDLNQYLSLAYLKQTREDLQLFYIQNTFLALGSYFLIYILTTTLSLPGAAVLSLAGAAIFGFWPALVIVSFASTIGATLAFLFARYLLRAWMQKKFFNRLARIKQGIEDEGAFYLFTMRLIPVFPFWMINLVMALTPLKALTFFWVSQVGMLPGTAVYVNAGTQLGNIDSVKDIFSFRILFSFALLGLFPLIVKKGMQFYRYKTGRPQQPS